MQKSINFNESDRIALRSLLESDNQMNKLSDIRGTPIPGKPLEIPIQHIGQDCFLRQHVKNFTHSQPMSQDDDSPLRQTHQKLYQFQSTMRNKKIPFHWKPTVKGKRHEWPEWDDQALQINGAMFQYPSREMDKQLQEINNNAASQKQLESPKKKRIRATTMYLKKESNENPHKASNSMQQKYPTTAGVEQVSLRKQIETFRQDQPHKRKFDLTAYMNSSFEKESHLKFMVDTLLNEKRNMALQEIREEERRLSEFPNIEAKKIESMVMPYYLKNRLFSLQNKIKGGQMRNLNLSPSIQPKPKETYGTLMGPSKKQLTTYKIQEIKMHQKLRRFRGATHIKYHKQSVFKPLLMLSPQKITSQTTEMNELIR